MDEIAPANPETVANKTSWTDLYPEKHKPANVRLNDERPFSKMHHVENRQKKDRETQKVFEPDSTRISRKPVPRNTPDSITKAVEIRSNTIKAILAR
jgi:hypothetical protein